MDTGTYIAENKQVYVHCIVDVCHVNDPTIECLRSCKGGVTVREKDKLNDELVADPLVDVHLHSGNFLYSVKFSFPISVSFIFELKRIMQYLTLLGNTQDPLVFSRSTLV